MEGILAGLEATALADALRHARWGYAIVNAVHIFGIALLVGAIVPLDLKLLGFWNSVPREALLRVLVPIAAAGLAIALCAGLLLFSIRARHYADIGFLQIKLTLILTGAGAALLLHTSHGFLLKTASVARLKCHAALSLFCWLGALLCGRMIAFAG